MTITHRQQAHAGTYYQKAMQQPSTVTVTDHLTVTYENQPPAATYKPQTLTERLTVTYDHKPQTVTYVRDGKTITRELTVTYNHQPQTVSR